MKSISSPQSNNDGLKLIFMAYALIVLASLTGCKPRTPVEKVQDAVEDAAHETRQGTDRAVKHLKEDVK